MWSTARHPPAAFDEAALLAAYTVAPGRERRSAAARQGAAGVPGAEGGVLSPQRAKNVGITLRGLGRGVTATDIVGIVDTLGRGIDGKVLLEMVVLMPLLLPTEAERRAFERVPAGAAGDAVLTPTERLVRRLGEAVQLEAKIRALSLVTHFIQWRRDLHSDADALSACVAAAVGSAALGVALTTAVAVGNTLNRGRPWGNAASVAPDALKTFSEFKDAASRPSRSDAAPAAAAATATAASRTLLDHLYDALHATRGVAFFKALEGETAALNAPAARLQISEVESGLAEILGEVEWLRSATWADVGYGRMLQRLFLRSPQVEELGLLTEKVATLKVAAATMLSRFAWARFPLEEGLNALHTFKSLLLAKHKKAPRRLRAGRGLAAAAAAKEAVLRQPATASDILSQWGAGTLQVAPSLADADPAAVSVAATPAGTAAQAGAEQQPPPAGCEASAESSASSSELRALLDEVLGAWGGAAKRRRLGR